MVEAILFVARTGCQWRYLPERFGPWGSVWQQWRRWRANGVWARAMTRLAEHIRRKHDRGAAPSRSVRSARSTVMIDARTVRGGRSGPTFHERGGRARRTFGSKRTVLVGSLGLPVAAHVESARRRDVQAGRELIRSVLPSLPPGTELVADREYRGLSNAAARRGASLRIDGAGERPDAAAGRLPAVAARLPAAAGRLPAAAARLPAASARLPAVAARLPAAVASMPTAAASMPTAAASMPTAAATLNRTFDQLERWRRLTVCLEGSRESARAWLEVACVGYLLGRT